MKDSARFIPSGIAGLALVGCLLPFATNNAANLFAVPDTFSQIGNYVGMFASIGPRRAGQPAFDPSASIWIARLVYLAPLAAIWIIVQSFRSAVSRGLLIVSAVIWISAVAIVPPIAGAALAWTNPVLRQLNRMAGGDSISFSLNFGIGGWLIILAGIAALLAGLGVLKVKPSSSPA